MALAIAVERRRSGIDWRSGPRAANLLMALSRHNESQAMRCRPNGLLAVARIGDRLHA
jgi:hypothetical protein